MQKRTTGNILWLDPFVKCGFNLDVIYQFNLAGIPFILMKLGLK